MDTVKFMVLLGFAGSILGQGAEYGQYCNTTTPCFSSNDLLECNTNVNRCGCPAKMFRDDELRMCVSPHNGTCTLRPGDGSPNRRCAEFARCWPNENSNGTVENEGICHCDLDAKYDELTWRCRLTHGSSRCKYETECDTYSLLTCRDGKCLCQDTNNQVYSEKEGKCVVLQGGSCVRKLPFLTPSCAENMHCTNEMCECEEGYVVTPERTCGKTYNATCEESSECHPQFICNSADENKFCTCRNGQEFFNGNCRILTGQSCEDNLSQLQDIFNCVQNATCVQGKCACNSDFKSYNGTCFGLLHSTCSENNNDVPCSSEDYLECKNTVCQCKERYQPDKEGKRCKGFIGEGCGNDSENCIANSLCLNKICTCGSKQIKQPDEQRCLAVLGGTCSVETTCSDNHFLACKNAVCECEKPEHQFADEEGSGCVAKAGAPCGKSSRDIKCVANSTCVTEDREYCKCNSGLVNNGEGVCIPVVGSGSSIYRSSSLLMLVIGVMIVGKLEVLSSCSHFGGHM